MLKFDCFLIVIRPMVSIYLNNYNMDSLTIHYTFRISPKVLQFKCVVKSCSLFDYYKAHNGSVQTEKGHLKSGPGFRTLGRALKALIEIVSGS